jgi:nitric oxide reductase subunit B
LGRREEGSQDGFWHARSNAFWQQQVVQTLGQLRLLPDTIFIIGALGLLAFMLKAVRKLKPVEVRSGESFS